MNNLLKIKVIFSEKLPFFRETIKREKIESRKGKELEDFKTIISKIREG